MKFARAASVVFLASCAIQACAEDENGSDAGIDAQTGIESGKADSSIGSDTGTADSSSKDGSGSDVTSNPETSTEAGSDAGSDSASSVDACSGIIGIFGNHYIRANGSVIYNNQEIALPLADGGAGAPLDGIVEGAQGSQYGCGRRSDGTVHCWSLGQVNAANSGQLGDGTFNWPPKALVAHQVLVGTAPDGGSPDGGPPTPMTDAVSLMRDTSVVYGATACAIRADKTAWCWGIVVSPFGSPKMITSAPTVGPVAAASQIVKQDGTALQNVEEVSVGMRHLCAITSDVTTRDSVYCWGGNIYNEVGDTLPDASAAVQRPFPTKVTRLPAGTKHQMSASAETSCVMVDDKAYCWGANDYGQAGTGAPQVVQFGCTHVCENRTPAPPVLVGPPDGGSDAGTPLTGLTALHGGYDFNCAIGAADALYCWGDNKGGVNGNTFRMAGPLMLGANAVTAKLITSYGAGNFPNNVRYLTPDGGLFSGTQQVVPKCP